MRFYESLRKFTKVDKSYDIPQYFFGQIPCFRSVSFACDVLFAFRNFVPWQTKFSCLLLYRIASRQYWQIFCHCQTIGDISNIADTYILHGDTQHNNTQHNYSKIMTFSIMTLSITTFFSLCHKSSHRNQSR